MLIVPFFTYNANTWAEDPTGMYCIDKSILSIESNAIKESRSHCEKVIKNLKLDVCAHYSSVLKQVKKKLPNFSLDSITQAFAYRQKYPEKFKGNPRYMMVADYSLNADSVRSVQIDLYSGEIKTRKISHGRTSDKSAANTGIFETCKKNGVRTNATRPGFFQVNNTYASSGSCSTKNKDGSINNYGKFLKKYGKPLYGCSHGEFRDDNNKLVYGWPYLGEGYPAGHNGIRMTGLNLGVNDEARDNGVVMHGAWYNQGSTMGRSYGCPAFHPKEFKSVADALKDGALFYSYTPKCSDDMKKVLKSIPNWQNTCKVY
jgi:hypothetical protein